MDKEDEDLTPEECQEKYGWDYPFPKPDLTEDAEFSEWFEKTFDDSGDFPSWLDFWTDPAVMAWKEMKKQRDELKELVNLLIYNKIDEHKDAIRAYNKLLQLGHPLPDDPGWTDESPEEIETHRLIKEAEKFIKEYEDELERIKHGSED